MAIETASKEDDQLHATDKVVHVTMDVAIAIRVRRPRRGWKFPFMDFTLRSCRYSKRDEDNEFAKIRAGDGRWYLYSWVSDEKTTTLDKWAFFDLDAFRKLSDYWFAANAHERINKDGATGFVPFTLFDMKRFTLFDMKRYGVLVAHHGIEQALDPSYEQQIRIEAQEKRRKGTK